MVEVVKQSTCMTCRFFKRNETEATNGLCKESSPQVTVLMVPQQNPFSGETSMTPIPIGAFPTVQETEWCGKYTAKWAGLSS